MEFISIFSSPNEQTNLTDMTRQFLSFTIIIVLSLLSCDQKGEQNSVVTIEFNQALADELSKMKVVDQLAASNAYPPASYSNLTLDEWKSFKDSVYKTNQKRVKEIFNEYGFVGYNLAGEEGSSNFWLIVQHSDHNPEFQNEILEKMKVEVDNGNANSSNYGLLVDRVKLNTGQPQVYGTQVDYNMEICQAFPKKLADSINVNKRRKEIGLEPIEEYLNQMTEINFAMNKEYYSKKGITVPRLYKVQ